MNIVILGSGVSGNAAASLAERLNFNHIIISDGDDFAPLTEADLIVCSPGIGPKSPLFMEAQKSQKEIISELEFGFRHWQGQVIALTGTDGKTTTTELTVALLQAVGVDAIPAGNIGTPLCQRVVEQMIGKLNSHSLPVIEVSSFQLELVSQFSPYAAALLNVANDHLDRYHGSLEEYGNVKRKIFNGVESQNIIFGRSMSESGFAPRVKSSGEEIFLDGELLLNFSDTQLKGVHNLENIIVALELALRVVGVEKLRSTALLDALSSFNAGRHRIELVGEFNGVKYINDSKATNPHAAGASIMSFENIHLLIGGLDKGMDFSELTQYASRIKCAYIYGECQEKIRQVFEGKISYKLFGRDFDGAISAAQQSAISGDTILLAPACASMDMFKNYKERGDIFCQKALN